MHASHRPPSPYGRYLGEIAPAHLRGTLGTSFLLTAVTGMLIGQLLGLPGGLGTADAWPLILASVCVPALFQVCNHHL